MKIAAFFIIAVLVFAVASFATNDRERALKERELNPNHEPLDKITFIHYKDGKVKIEGKGARAAVCYKLLDVKWTTLPVNYVINPSNSGLDVEFVTTAISTAAETWDAATSKELFNDTYAVDYNINYGVQDYKNAITFGSYPDNNVIAITSIWYTRVGKKIVEFDMLFNTYYTWGDATANPNIMDLQNIATHELGHSVGLDDVYNSACSAVTMYGYSNYGETQKRTLEQPDVTGLQKIYGA